MTTKHLALSLMAVLLAAAPVHAEDSDPQGDGGDADDCPAVQITPWAPYVSFKPDCLPEIPDIPDIPQP